MFIRRTLIAAIALGFLIIAPPTYAQHKSILVTSTTSTQDSGLFEYYCRSLNKRPEAP
jgi:ABC-type tungstate transport system permease subunit